MYSTVQPCPRDRHDPRIPRDSTPPADAELGSLPAGWEKRETATGRPYFVDHHNRTTQFTDPRLSGPILRVMQRARIENGGGSSTTTASQLPASFPSPTAAATAASSIISETVATPTSNGDNTAPSLPSTSSSSVSSSNTTTAPVLPSPAKISRPLPPLPVEESPPADSSVAAAADSAASSEPRLDVTDGLAMSILEAVVEAPPRPPPTVNPAVTNVRAPHILPNLAALRALDLNDNPQNNENSLSTTPSSATPTADVPTTALPPAVSEAAPTTPQPLPPPSTPRNHHHHHPESPKPSSNLLRSLFDNEESLPKYKRDLVAKMKVLRSELTSLQPQSGHCRLEVSRQEIFEDSYRQASQKGLSFSSVNWVPRGGLTSGIGTL